LGLLSPLFFALIITLDFLACEILYVRGVERILNKGAVYLVDYQLIWALFRVVYARRQ
jgi:hypothetical protein